MSEPVEEVASGNSLVDAIPTEAAAIKSSINDSNSTQLLAMSSTSDAARSSSGRTTMKSYRCHQVPSRMNSPPRRQTAPTRRSVLTSVIFLIVVSAQWRHHNPLSRSNTLVAEASTLTRTQDVPQQPANTSVAAAAASIISTHQPAAALKPSQITFSTPNQAINITHVTYDPLHDTIYLGATNTIFQLSGSDLSLQHEHSTGPIYDNPSCGIVECHGFEDNMKLTQDINKLLVIDYQHKKLLSCGSTKQGACRRYQLNNISQREDLIPMPVAANDANSTTYAFVAPARYDSASTGNGGASSSSTVQQQQVLYVGSTYTKAIGQSRELLVPSIGTRTLDDGPNLLKLYESSFVDSRIDINSHLRDYFLVNYMYGFASSSHIYFVTVQKKATSRDLEELGYHTRLARICITDSSYNSYTEVDLKCVPNKRRGQRQQQQQKHNYFGGQQQTDQPGDYPLLQDAILVDAGSQLLHSLAQNDQLSGNSYFSAAAGSGSSPDDNKVLLGVFSSAKDHTQHAGDHSALCAFSLAQIEDKFNENIQSCYTGKMQSRNMEYIAGNVPECPKSGQGGNMVNYCHETLKINGSIPIVSEAAIQYFNTTLTAITATSYVNAQVKNIYSEQLSSELASEQSSKRDSLFGASSSASSKSASNGPRQHTIVFTGTSSGHIKKILLNNASNGVEFEDVQLDTQTILSDLHLHSSGNQLIAATPYKVFKVPTHNCAQYASCRECSQSRNPYCGWCLLKKSCTSKSECTSSSLSQAGDSQRSNSIQEPAANSAGRQQQLQAQPKWISAEASGKCIDLQSIVPDKIPMTSTGKLDLYIDRLPRLPKEHSYRCVFNRSEQTTATTTQFGLSCPLPKLMDRQRNIQIQPGRDHAIVELAVRSSETNTDFLDGKITFFDCQRHTTCKDCLTTNWGCNWCLNENVCLFNTSKCDKTTGIQAQSLQPATQLIGGGSSNQRSSWQQASIVVGSTSSSQSRGSTLIGNVPSSGPVRSSNTISQVQQCPTFDVGHQQDILIADGSERELSIRVKNMPQFKGAMKCIVEIENYEIPLKAHVQEDRVICENSTYSYAADVGLLNGQLKVIYSDSNIYIDRTNLTLYKCHLLGAYLNRPDCSLCQRIDQRFGCAWCSGSCQHRSRCAAGQLDETCPPPRIDFIHPLSGPLLGGTRVTIEGSNLGQTFEEIAGRVSIGQAPCKPLEDEYRPSNRIVCMTSPALSRHNQMQLAGSSLADSLPADIAVGNRAGYTFGAQKFHFKTVHLYNHQPRHGPQSGGTRILLQGHNLNIGSSVQVFLDELPCLVEMSSLTSEQLVCRTSPSRQSSRAIRHLKLIIDDAQLVRDDDVFYYTADPVVTKVSPLRAYLGGGRPINVQGTNLTVVQSPRMAIYDTTTGKKINESLCIAQDDTWMQCPAPAVNLQMMDLEYAEQHLLNSYEPNSQQYRQNTVTPAATTTTGLSGKPLNFISQHRILQQDESIRFRVGFIMDGAMQTGASQLQTELAYTSDPKLYPFASAQYRSMQQEMATEVGNPGGEHNFQIELDTFLLQPGEPTLTLYGEHLRAAVSEYEITVTVGRDLCNLTQLSQSRLVCAMPLDKMATPTDEDGHQTERSLPLVVVRIGFNLRYELGYVQYHPQLVAQIDALQQNLSSPQAIPDGLHQLLIKPSGDMSSLPTPCLTHPIYKGYMPCEAESTWRQISNGLASLLMLVGYILLSVLALGLIYSGLFKGLRLKERVMRSRAHKEQLARLDSLERSLKNECRVGSLALQGDLNELVRHIELSGVPLLGVKHYIMKVFFPGISNHPLLLRPATSSSGTSNLFMIEQQQQQPTSLNGQQHVSRPADGAQEMPMENFERLLHTKAFLVAFVNTLEQQPSFTIRDKVNVASLLMIVLMERLDYATDIMKTLLFQLVERSVSQLQENQSDLVRSDEAQAELQDEFDYEDGSVISKTTRRLTRRASNLLNGLPISKRHYHQQASGGSRLSAGNQLGKMVNGGASSLMETTSVAAQMLLARVGHKTSPLASEAPAFYQQSPGVDPMDFQPEYMSTTTFNDNSIAFLPYKSSTASTRRHGELPQPPRGSLVGRRQHRRGSSGKQSARGAKLRRLRCKRQAQLMLRRTDSIVEKMLTNWLALNMYDQFQGPVGQSLYMLFEALKSQLERGPVDAVSGDAYYSLCERKILRGPNIRFEVVNLYVIVDTDILNMDKQQQSQVANLMLDNNCLQQLAPEALNFEYHQQQASNMSRLRPFNTVNNRASQQSYSMNNTITLALRALDCDTISQVKAKILSALYRNSPYSSRVGPNEVELSLRRHVQSSGHQTLASSQQQQLVTLVLSDDDSSFIGAYNPNGPRQLNTLRHYGVTDQGIMMMKRAASNRVQQPSEDHYSSPYAEIQYGQCRQANGAQQQQQASTRITSQQDNCNNQHAKAWHLIRSDIGRTSARLSDNSQDSSSSPSSNSPSMMLLGNNGQQHHHPNSMLHQQQFYHPSSSSTSSTGNVLDTHSTSANSNSIMQNMMRHQQQQQYLLTTNNPMAGQQQQDQVQQPIYCQIGSISAQSQRVMAPGDSQYYCQIGAGNQAVDAAASNHQLDYLTTASMCSSSNRAIRSARDGANSRASNQDSLYLTRMLTSKGTIQKYIDNFFETILTAKSASTGQNAQFYEDVLTQQTRTHFGQAPTNSMGACPAAVKWIFDILDEAASRNKITDENVIFAWKSNAFLLRFWVNIIKNPDYFLDVEKSDTLDSSLSVIAQTLMDACAPAEGQKSQLVDEADHNKLIFSKDLPKFREMVKHFYHDVSAMRPVSDYEMAEQMSILSMSSANGGGKFDTNLALRELCVYAVNYGTEIMNTLNNDYACQQLDLSQQLERCFSSFSIFGAYR